MDRPIFNRFPHMLLKNISALFFAGMFFFSMPAWSDPLGLATDLFEKNEWDLCRRECKRALLDGTEPLEKFQLLETLSNARRGTAPSEVMIQLQPIVTSCTDVQVSAIAAYELGRLQWQLDQPEEALGSFETAFNTTTNKSLFLHSSCSMFLLFKEHRKLKRGNEALISQINTSRSEWYGPLFFQCAKPDSEKDKSPAPNWIVSFYRAQVSPAIGDRCTLEPSCSEYFNQAYCKHGLKSIPMIADRFFREPEVSNNKEDPVVKENGQIRYGDPLENHDFWMKKK